MNNFTSKSNNTKLWSTLKSDNIKYNKFISKLSYKYNPNFLNNFLDFLWNISTKSKDEQKFILTNPELYNYDKSFAIDKIIFTEFIYLYWEYWDIDDKYEIYFDLISKIQTSITVEVKSNINNAINTEQFYNKYRETLDNINIWFEEELKSIWNIIWQDKRLLWENSWLSINDILEIRNDLLLENGDIANFEQNQISNYIKPYLLKNIYICQNILINLKWIWQKIINNLESTYPNTEDGIETKRISEEKIYTTIVENLSKRKQPTRVRYDETYRFARPIINNIDFERLYLNFISFVYNHFGDAKYIYDYENQDNKVWNIENITYYFTDITSKQKTEKISPIDYIDKLTNKKQNTDNSWKKQNNSEKYTNIDRSTLDATIKDDIIEDIWLQINQREDETNQEIEKHEESIVNELESLYKVRLELPKYYQIAIYISYNHKEKLPNIILQLDLYENIFDKNKNREKVLQYPKPIIIKPSFCIDDSKTLTQEYMQKFIWFLDKLSPDWDCLSILDINI